ncbi:hypothetical protein OESDEN_17772, partial [Oesophagostomum dentatum]
FRIRINTNTQYSKIAREEYLAQIIIAESEDFESLFNELMYFIWKSRSREPQINAPSKEDSRLRSFPANFKHRVNSTMMTAVAKRCEEYDQMVFVRNQYHSFTSEENAPTPVDKGDGLCCCCRSVSKTDLFLSPNGMMCKDCIASNVLHQLRLSQFPIEIPLITPANCSPLDLLYAILPVPLISVLIKNSFSHFYAVCNPDGVFTTCPQCTRSLTIDEPNEPPRFQLYSLSGLQFSLVLPLPLGTALANVL